MANGVLASFHSATSKYANQFLDRAVSPNGLVRADFPMYTCPGARLASGSLRIMNTTGASLTVDVGIQDYSDVIQFAAPASQVPVVNNFEAFSFPVGTYTTSSYVVISAHNGTAYQDGETVTITESGGTLQGTQTAVVCKWDQSNLKLWLKDFVGDWPVTVLPNVTITGNSSGGAGTITDSAVGTWGRVTYYDFNTGTLLLQNSTLKNNIFNTAATYGDQNTMYVSAIGGAGQLSVQSRAIEWLPSLSTVTLYNAANLNGTAVTAEWVSENLAEVVVASVSYSESANQILKSYTVPNGSEVSLTGLVLEQYQNLYVNASSGAVFNFIGFEEATSIY